MLARDVMTREVISVHPDDTVQQLTRVLTEAGISGAPVLDSEGKLVGIISEADVISKRGHRVEDVMQRHVISVPPDLSVSDVSCVLCHNRVNRVPVLEDGELVGIITRADIVRAIAVGSLQPDLTVPESAGSPAQSG
ncbi:MAG: CBS domain-containing protein [Chloroflexota bacterium]|nr:CBS domain-containing protein [Chloroflexota bacterium]